VRAHDCNTVGKKLAHPGMSRHARTLIRVVCLSSAVTQVLSITRADEILTHFQKVPPETSFLSPAPRKLGRKDTTTQRSLYGCTYVLASERVRRRVVS
jgi:hypothetical protein